ncbi:MAG: hypothetical protein HYV59_07415 [Planctomycetes bacterium]|nr:hypothetical protein [Planctomycetota bacterium]
MALWKRKKKAKESEDTARKEGASETSEADVSAVTATEAPPAKEETRQEETVSEKPSESEAPQVVQEDLSGGVILYGKKISGVFGKGFWGIFSIAILPPVFIFAFGILVIVCMLVFPLLAVMLVASVPVVFVTLSIFAIALPIVFPLLIIFLLITGKGRLLIGSEGKWFGLEMFGKSYTLK